MEYDREKLLGALNSVYPVLGGGVVSEYGYFWFDKTSVYTTDSGLGVRLSLETDLDCGLPGKQLRDLLRTSAVKTVTIEAGKNDATLTMGRSKVKLSMLNSERRPWKYPDPPESGMVITEAVRKAWDQISFVKVSEGKHAFHHGVVMIPKKGAVDYYATDSKSIACHTLSGAYKGPPVILPWPWVHRVQALTKAGAFMVVLDDCLVAVGEGVDVFSNLLEFPESPNLPKLLDQHITDDVVLTLPEGFRSVLDRASILANGSEPWVAFELKKGTLRMTGKYTVGSLDESLPVKGKVADKSGEFQAPLLARGLNSADGFVLADKAVLLYGGEDFVYLVAGR